ncbi:MAG: porin family protein [Chlamydiia bacterium]|nr:porin family protein [Chlamydiia bacterium]
MKKTLPIIFACMGLMTTLFAEEAVTPYYLKSFDSFNWLNGSGSSDGDVSFRPGYMGALAVGYKLQPGVISRVELELAYRKNSVDHLTDFYGDIYYINGRTESTSLFVNTYYDFYNCSRFTPYIGVGAGYTHTSANLFDQYVSVDGTSHGFTTQFIAGVNTRITERLDLGLEYRYHLGRSNYHEQNLGVTLSINI